MSPFKLQVSTDVPAGYSVQIDHAIGTCEGSTSYTEMFKVTSYDGTRTTVKYEKTTADGKPIDVTPMMAKRLGDPTLLDSAPVSSVRVDHD